jgi:hypothetical protein
MYGVLPLFCSVLFFDFEVVVFGSCWNRYSGVYHRVVLMLFG